jgi:hypothetical protein
MTGFGTEFRNRNKSAPARHLEAKDRVRYHVASSGRGGAFHRENTTKRKMNQLLRD